MTRTVLVLTNGTALFSIEPFEALNQRLEMIRTEIQSEEGIGGSPLSAPMLRTEIIFAADTRDPVAASVNPLHLAALYEHPEDAA